MAKRYCLPYYEQNVEQWNKVAVTERAIKNIEIEGVPIKGNLDKMEFDGKNVTVVDYKTGKLKNAKDKFLRPTNDEPEWRRLLASGGFLQNINR